MLNRLLFGLICLFLIACQTTPTNPEFWMEREINACLPTAIIFKQSLKKYGIWSEVFKYSWKDYETGKLKGHAMVAYLYPQGKNQLWTYDAEGSFRVRAYTNNVLDIAQKAHYIRGWTNKVLSAEYLK
ncbi:hypothetical protein EBU94_02720 [bacterium]|nr:hypothetical protein [bacterium]NBO36581.1 hypothetical protein [bacterium]